MHRLTHLCQHADPFWCLHFAGCWLFTNHLWLFIYLYKRVCFCFLNSYSKQKASTSIFNIMYIQHVLDNQHTTFKKLGLSNWGLFPIVPVFFHPAQHLFQMNYGWPECHITYQLFIQLRELHLPGTVNSRRAIITWEWNQAQKELFHVETGDKLKEKAS